ncbi:Short-chain dehydrogenase/reductase SDR OS=Tsukamurella paurometabola (strain ATCC 8368 / DSM/ CCUG 35730 / CIP 100753 / JCM 10117 / KCTC 9821 / NBRC 16120/ NCIMB 702349 / NCTC 13040) OX=521096 GN=Tpau_1853 PE=3 SV=1 [Tsukamurella paurometabola]|uniref:Short-chain dehydrogenase/reductase SDR n=1 Tax=Tsukamurella paurometabola (strain ATCC 8368 / DSM 20162 / CCUG 35730 / CIP 100753 / JCM 10117 / KCTC 9821 / NBRC 16120 / NCIMB 702349 / NCTC 13040) TaxID=521096 RepID=D5UMX1_TSUPD|nr:SDR family oxidoreductase [Tsukamurella paurometabola]ADG78468.1 short-chain dehydrogenase/reductase SDR [Tsukamurella paurometabola DSM 20162]SUP31766.1 3-oxoacyl-[acyl-carrier-protein] reductase FabG [Tsukamurella paurometabola]
MAGRFDGRTAIVTGASRGIGLAIAQRLVADGAKVVITARKQEALDTAVAELGGPGAAVAVAGSGDDLAHQDEVIATAIDTFGSADYFVNNTGINPVYGPLMDLDVGAARKIMEVNVMSTLSWVQKVNAAWQREHGGAIVNVASVAGLRPAPGIAFYGVSKAAVIHLTEELAVELGPDIRVNAVAPAVVKTRFATALYEGREDEVSSAYPLKRLGVPDDIGSVVAFLLSDDAGWMTGQTLTIDGGVLLTGGV